MESSTLAVLVIFDNGIVYRELLSSLRTPETLILFSSAPRIIEAVSSISPALL
jgi:hypothetical protein